MVPPFFIIMIESKQVCLLLALLFSIGLNAQNFVKFSLLSDGTFSTKDKKTFIVVEYEGKTAQELYNMIKANVLTSYNNPQNVLNEIEPTNITIRAVSNVLYSTYGFGSGFTEYAAKYTLVFQFKDGKIRVNAPEIDTDLIVNASGAPIPKTFISLIDGWFDKNGGVKKRKQENVSNIEFQFNYIINYLLGNFKKREQPEEENW